jgi:hypothetical protein
MQDIDAEPDPSRPDFGLISALGLPAHSRVPHGRTGLATPEEYDRYFRIVRREPDLADWSRTCLQVGASLLRDLDRSGLSSDDKCTLLKGLVEIERLTLERWVRTADEAANR